MKHIFITASLLFITILSNAQGDAKAKAILDKVSANVKSLKALKANFSITITGAKTKPQTTITFGIRQYSQIMQYRHVSLYFIS
jgi:outer membrane lipoprotein-sorting protein